MMKNSMRKLILMGCLFSPFVFADEAPVDSLTTNGPVNSSPQRVAAPPAQNLTIDQRVSVLERQISTMNQIDLVNQVSHLQQQVQDLEGQIQVLSHSLQTVQTQSTSQYADIDKRLETLKTSSPVVSTTSSSSASSTTTSQSTSSTPRVDEKTLYDDAYKNIKAQRNADAIEGLKKYLAQYPNGKYAVSAHYWLGQLYILKGDDKSVNNAVDEFDTVIKKYPHSDKAREANLKLGFAYLLQNKNEEARKQFHKVIKQYPGTSTAQLAEARLAQLS